MDSRPYEHQITKVTQGEKELSVDWGDGHRSRFHFLWLRDACQCEACGIPGFGDRTHPIGELPMDIHPVSASVDEQGNLCIEWSHDAHRTVIESGWLRGRCYSRSERDRRRSKPALWDNTSPPDLTPVAYQRLLEHEATQFELLERRRIQGIAIVGGTPAAEQGIREVARCIGVIRETNYGHVYDIKLDDDPETFANLTPAIRPHTDEAYRPYPPGVIMLQCVQPTADGSGASIFVDGFAAVQRLRETSTAAVEILSRIPTPYHRVHQGEVDFEYHGRCITLDHEDRVAGVRFTTHSTSPPNIAADKIEPYYDARRRLTKAINDPRGVVQRLLAAGEIAITDNERVLHGRTALAEGSGRHIRGTMVEKDGMLSRWRLLAESLGKDPRMTFPGGAAA